MIPKIIHHIWLGDAEPDAFLQRCQQSALNLHHDWQHLYHRDESAFDDPAFDDPFRQRLKEAAKRVRGYRTQHHPLALLSDLLRLAVVYIHGGIYLDMDMEVIKPLDDCLGEDLILSAFGAGDGRAVGEFILGAPLRSSAIMMILTRLLAMRPIRSNVGVIAPSVYPGLVIEHRWRVFPPEIFCPLNHDGRGTISDATRVIHHWSLKHKRCGEGKST